MAEFIIMPDMHTANLDPVREAQFARLRAALNPPEKTFAEKWQDMVDSRPGPGTTVYENGVPVPAGYDEMSDEQRDNS